MVASSCPQCGIRLTTKERQLKKCPVCSTPLAQALENVITPEMQARLEQIPALVNGMGQPPLALQAAPPKPIRRSLRFFGGGFLLMCGLGLVVVYGVDVKNWIATLCWPTARATVTHSAVATLIGRTNRGRTVTSYEPAVKCKYQVAGRDFETSQLLVGRDWSRGGLFRSAAEKVAAVYPVGSETDVAYDPGDPGTAFIRRQLSMSVLNWLVISLSLTWLALRLFVPSVVSTHLHSPSNLTIFRSQATEVDGIALGVFVVGFLVTNFASSSYVL